MLFNAPDDSCVSSLVPMSSNKPKSTNPGTADDSEKTVTPFFNLETWWVVC